MSNYRRGLMANCTTEPIEIIEFEDATVKQICVSNWGGTIVPGEITTKEAAVVTSLDDKFKQNTTITSFKELRYFTGITSFPTTVVQSFGAGQFYGCTNLEEVIMPAVNVPSVSGLFRSCTKLKSLDLSPITSQTLNVSNLCREAKGLEEVTFPNCNISGDAYYLFRLCTVLHTINFGTSDWEGITNYSNAFFQCSALKNITGTPTGFNRNFEVNWCPLTMDSLRIILNGLYDYVGHGSTTTRTLRINANLLNSISDDDRAIATSKGWTLNN